MKTTLINDYLDNLSKTQREKLMRVIKFIAGEVENVELASVFTLPGFTVDYLPICNIRAKRKTITVRFFQKDVFAVFAEKLGDLKHGKCSVTFEEPEEFMIPQIKKLLEVTATATKVDAGFLRSIRMRDYGYYNNSLLSPRRKPEKKDTAKVVGLRERK